MFNVLLVILFKSFNMDFENFNIFIDDKWFRCSIFYKIVREYFC